MACLAATPKRSLASANANAHMRYALAFHDGLNVRKVQIDQAGHRDQVRNALDTLAQHIVCHAERIKMLVPLPTTSSSLSLGMMTNVSTFSLIAAMPCSALRARCCPQEENGRGNNAHRENPPSARAIAAITGAAPVPVPPPAAAVIEIPYLSP